MSDEIRLVISGNADEAIAALKKLNTALADTSGQATTVGAGLDRAGSDTLGFGRQVQTAGYQARGIFKSVGDAVRLMGVDADSAFVRTVESASTAVGIIGTLAGSFSAMNGVLLGVMAVGAGVALITNHFRTLAEDSKKATEAIRKPFEEAQTKIKALSELTGFQALAQQLGVSEAALEKWSSGHENASASVLKLNELSRQEKEAFEKIGPALAHLNELKERYAEMSTIDFADTESLAGAIGLEQKAVDDIASAYEKAQAAKNAYLGISAGQMKQDVQHDLSTAFANATERIADFTVATQTLGTSQAELNMKQQLARDAVAAYDQILKDNGITTGQAVLDSFNLAASLGASTQAWQDGKKAGEDYANVLKDIAKAQDNILKGMLSKAIAPTTVMAEEQKRLELLVKQRDLEKQLTNSDLGSSRRRRAQDELAGVKQDLAELGPYVDKWDEFARRAKAIAAGANIGAFGDKWAADFSALASKTRMSASQLANAFQDFSLFADKSNLKLIDMQAVKENVQHQIDAMIGQYNVMKAATSAVYKSLGKDQKAALRELAIDSAGDMAKTMMGVGDKGNDALVKGLTDKEAVKKQKGSGDTIMANISAGIVASETQVKWIATFDSALGKAHDQFKTKENVEKLKIGGAAILDNIAAGVSADTALSEAMMHAVDQAIKDAIDRANQYSGASHSSGAMGNPGSPMADGGFGVATAGQTFRADAGEGYWFSGKNWNVPPPAGTRSSDSSVTVIYSPQVSFATRDELVKNLVPLVKAANDKIRRRTVGG
jgi:hypothetical protein